MRNHPTIAARQLAHDYFQNRGMESPEAQADEFLPRIHIYRKTGEWRSDTLIETALKIVDAQAEFDVDDLVENYLHAILNIESLRDYDKAAGSPVFGLTYPWSREILICDRAVQNLPLYRTSVAHEVGHLILHGASQEMSPLPYAPGAPKRPSEETEADEFMIALLAPPNVIKIAVGLAAIRSGLHLSEVWHSANTLRGRRQWKDYILPRLVDSLCLSRLLLTIQMIKLGVFTEETGEFHKTYALPNRWRRQPAATAS